MKNSRDKDESRNCGFTLKELGKPKSLIKFVKDRPGHDLRYSLDCKKIVALGWKPRYSFDSALKETINGIKKTNGGGDP